jgi:hypothetical protein
LKFPGKGPAVSRPVASALEKLLFDHQLALFAQPSLANLEFAQLHRHQHVPKQACCHRRHHKPASTPLFDPPHSPTAEGTP